MKSARYILLHADLIIVRLMLGLSSLLWAIMLFWPGDTFGRPTYDLMSHWASETTWAIVFLIHAASVFMAIFCSCRTKAYIFFEGILGCLLWTASCSFMIFSVYPPPAAIAAEIITALFSILVLARYPMRGVK